jgi:hypothetical protein
VNRQRIVLAAGGGAALLLGIVVAAVIMGRNRGASSPPPASKGGLEVSVNEAPALDPKKKVRCFVDGSPIGEFTIAECAAKNGVGAQALDVGLDDSGNLAAAPTASLSPTPALPPAPGESAPSGAAAGAAHAGSAPAPSTPATQASTQTGRCLRYTGTDWRDIADNYTLNACIQALFAGRCVHPGEAVYGRFGETTLRLVPGQVQQSSDNRNFHTVVEQKRGCDIPNTR